MPDLVSQVRNTNINVGTRNTYQWHIMLIMRSRTKIVLSPRTQSLHSCRTVFQTSPPTFPIGVNDAHEALLDACQLPEICRPSFCAKLGVDYERVVQYLDVVRNFERNIAGERMAAYPHLLLDQRPMRRHKVDQKENQELAVFRFLVELCSKA